MINSVSIAKKLKELRLTQRLKMFDLAVRSGVREPQISSYENDRSAPSLLNLVRLADALGIETGELITITGAQGNGSPTTASSIGGKDVSNSI